MIDDRTLDAAVAAGVIDPDTRSRLTGFARDLARGEAGPDEEQFRLLTGFNDIFVTIAIGLLLAALGTLGGAVTPLVGTAAVAVASWGLAEYFTRQRRMALPSIALLLAFVGAVLATGAVLVTGQSSFNFGPGEGPPAGLIAAAAAGALAAYAHWRRFRVPITVAAGAGTLVLLLLAGVAVAAGGEPAEGVLLPLLGLSGLAIFLAAMWFDASDRARVTRRTDVAFWLHLLAAPLIVHPIFSLTGLLDRNPGPEAALAVIAVYAVLTIVALAIDRRALLVSALLYVIWAIQALFAAGLGIGEGFGLTALVLGLFLVMLSAAWRPIRARVVALLPENLSGRLPVAG